LTGKNQQSQGSDGPGSVGPGTDGQALELQYVIVSYVLRVHFQFNTVGQTKILNLFIIHITSDIY